jgi:hypothetical protein
MVSRPATRRLVRRVRRPAVVGVQGLTVLVIVQDVHPRLLVVALGAVTVGIILDTTATISETVVTIPEIVKVVPAHRICTIGSVAECIRLRVPVDLVLGTIVPTHTLPDIVRGVLFILRR